MHKQWFFKIQIVINHIWKLLLEVPYLRDAKKNFFFAPFLVKFFNKFTYLLKKDHMMYRYPYEMLDLLFIKSIVSKM